MSLGLATDEAVARYQRDGFVILNGLMGDLELASLRKVFDNLGNLPNRVDKFGRSVIEIRNLWQNNPEIKLLVWRVAPVAARMMGFDKVRLLDDVAFIKPARQEGGDPTIWHQDAPNYPFDRRGFLTIWIAVDDIPLEQGPLSFVPGSHRLGPLGAVDGGGEQIRLESLLQTHDRAYIRAPVTTAYSAGDASVHDGYMLHSASANLTCRPRRAWAARFIPPATLYTGGAHRWYDGLKLTPFEPFEHDDFPVIDCTDAKNLLPA